MKFLMMTLLTLFSANAMAYGSIVISTNDNSSVEIAWLGSEADESEVELAWEKGGQDSVFNGNICFKGVRKEAIQVLEYLDSNDFMGDEYRIQNIHYVGPDKISYEIYDGPNDVTLNKLVISACK